MSFTQRAATKPQKIGACAIRDILVTLPDDEADALRSMLAESPKDRPHKALAKDIADEGFPMSDATVGRHRRGECSCRLLVDA